MKKLFIILMAFLIIVPTIQAYDDDTNNDITIIDDMCYKLNYTDSTAMFTTMDYRGGGCFEYPGDISIPPYVEYDGITFTVTSIGGSSFYAGGTTSLHIPETVVNICEWAFYYMYDLCSVTVDEANPAFMTVDGVLFTRDMKKMYLFPTHLARSEDGKEMKFEEYTVPEGVEEIYASFHATGLKRVMLPNTLKKLGTYALNCSTLTEINLPESLEYMGTECLSGTTIQSELYIPESVSFIGSYCFSSADFTSINIPKNITCIDHGMFRYTRHLESVELHEGLTKICSDAFEYSALKTLDLPSTLTELESNVFFNSNIESIDLPDGITYLGYFVFQDSALVRINLGQGVERIGRAFYGCENLRDIYSPKITPPEIDDDDPLGLGELIKRYPDRITVHVPEGCKEAYESTPWKKVGIIVEDLTNSVEEIGDENAILDNELCDAYTISGAHVASSLKYSDMRANLSKGLYIIRTATGKSAKITIG